MVQTGRWTDGWMDGQAGRAGQGRAGQGRAGKADKQADRQIDRQTVTVYLY